MKISIIVPVYNEAASLPQLFKEITSTCNGLPHEYEIIAVDDGSKDGSFEVLREAAKNDKHIRAVCFRRNSGQTAALAAGFALAQGDVVIPIDSDLENDPQDIPKLLAKLEEGYDVVSGWRVGRWKQQRLTRKLPSSLANHLISRVTGVPLHDFGCTLKAYRREFVTDIRLYGEMHRFIPAYAAWQGARVTEIPVAHRERKFGRSNYGISRTFRVLLDLLLIAFLERYMNRPIHFFGGLGFLSLAGGFVAGFAAVVLKLLDLRSFVATPLPIFSALLIIVGVQLIALGVIGEILMRVYYESQGRVPYAIREKLNF